jgi:hypothetical protein
MSQLENTAARVLTPLILGTSAVVEGGDLGAIAAWVQKTCLTAIYVSTADGRAAGYGLPASEYHELYNISDEQKPLPDSQFWIGRIDGTMAWSVRATLLVVEGDELPEREFPDGYVMTIVLGKLLLHGVRMTTPGLDLAISTKQDMQQIWPDVNVVGWPAGEAVRDDNYQAFALGRDLRVQDPHFSLLPWKAATDLAASQPAGDMVELPTACGKHAAYYPNILFFEAMQGRFYAFVVHCDCGVAYLIHTEPDGAHCKACGDARDIAPLYSQMPGSEDTFTSGSMTFRCKRLT